MGDLLDDIFAAYEAEERFKDKCWVIAFNALMQLYKFSEHKFVRYGDIIKVYPEDVRYGDGTLYGSCIMWIRGFPENNVHIEVISSTAGELMEVKDKVISQSAVDKIISSAGIELTGRMTTN